MRAPTNWEWRLVLVASALARAWWAVRGAARRAVGLCPDCPRRIRSGHKMDCNYEWRMRHP